MSQINPFTGSILQATNVQRTQAAEKDRALQRVREIQKNSAQGMDQFENQVESAEAIDTDDHQEQTDPRKRKPRRGKQGPQDDGSEDSPKLDLRA